MADPAPAGARAAALARALRHLSREYLWVGVLERFEASLHLLVQQLPGFFGELDVEQAREQIVR